MGKTLPPSMQFYLKGNLHHEHDEDEELARRIRTAFNQRLVKQILSEYNHIKEYVRDAKKRYITKI